MSVDKANRKLGKKVGGYIITNINPKTGRVTVWNEPEDAFLFHAKSVDRAIEICIERSIADELGYNEWLAKQSKLKTYTKYYLKHLNKLRRKR